MTIMVSESVIVDLAARIALALHRPALDLLCQGCLDGGRPAVWPWPQATRAGWFLLAETAGEKGDRP